MSTVVAPQYSFQQSTLFLWDVDGGYVRTIVPLCKDAPVQVGADVDDSSTMATAERREKLLFHIQSGDYFGMLATALGFVEDKLHPSPRAIEKESIPSAEALLVRDLRDDLRYLHDNYDISPKKTSARKSRAV